MGYGTACFVYANASADSTLYPQYSADDRAHFYDFAEKFRVSPNYGLVKQYLTGHTDGSAVQAPLQTETDVVDLMVYTKPVATFTDKGKNVADFLQRTVPAPFNAYTIYFIVLPKNIVAVQGTSKSCTSFCGYHSVSFQGICNMFAT